MNINDIFPKRKNIIETYAYHDKPLYFLYKSSKSMFIVFFYKENSTFEKWICVPISTDKINELKASKYPLNEFIKRANLIVILTTDYKKNNIINREEVSYSYLEEDYLPNRDSYLKGNALFNVKFNTDIVKVENLVLEHLTNNEFKHFKQYKELKLKNSNFIADSVLIDEKDRKIFIEVKYFKFSKNVQYRKITDHIISLHNRYQLGNNSSDKLIYIIIIKNEEEDSITTVQRKLGLNKNYIRANAINSEVRIYSVYDLIEGELHFLSL
ncbi:DUF6575 domain-containing protein [Mesobacillus subterraneus]|uniref:Uncharacterized protein n=1 Tax=Mesobacillus subterraneus TaxID=285983 RepID=A0A3R9E746_9BACI|nr:DUF6575 domain-containing protein [Mesobacillus subterraneus]RSD27614.1 hypothetical protein EJA10_07470 [Mesobacillus subterraneus]